MRKKKKKIVAIRKIKKSIISTILFLSLSILCLFFVLEGYLFCIQKDSRLSKKEEFNDFELHYSTNNRCEVKEIFKKESITYFYDCLDIVYLKYGEIELRLEEAIEKEYINLKMLLESTTFDGREGESSIYISKPHRGKEPYKIKLTETKEGTFVTISADKKE